MNLYIRDVNLKRKCTNRYVEIRFLRQNGGIFFSYPTVYSPSGYSACIMV